MSENTTRDTIARLIKESGAPAAAEDEQEAAPASDESEAPPEAAEASEAAEGDEEAAVEPKAAAKPGERPRRADGKFAAAEKAAAASGTAPGAQQQTKAAEQVAPVVEALKPPADWSAKARAHWDKLPRDVQEESLRLHVETKKTLQEAATHRQAAEGWQKQVAPYEPIFRTAGVDPRQGVQNVLGIYAQLVTGAPDVRQKVAAELIRQFVGTDEASLRALGAHLEAKPAPAAALRPEQVTDLVRKQLEQERTQTQFQAESQALAAFEAQPPEFLSKVQPEFVELVKVQRGLGKPITKELLQQCYDKACKMNDDTAAVLKQRADSAKAKENAAAAAKGRAAASGIKNEPPGPAVAGKASSTRDEVKRQMERLSRGGGAHV